MRNFSSYFKGALPKIRVQNADFKSEKIQKLNL